MPKLSTLLAIAGGFGIGIGTLNILVNRQKDKFANQAVFIQKALDMFKSQPDSKKLIGESFEVGRASFKDNWSKMEQNQVRIRLPLKGENDDAYLYVYARKKHQMDKFRLFKLEATFGKIQGKRLVLLDRTDEEDPDEEREAEVKPEKADEGQPAAAAKQMSPKELMKNWKWN